MLEIDYQALMGGGGLVSAPSPELVDTKVRWYVERYWKREPKKCNRFQRSAMVFVLVNYFDHPKTRCADLFECDRSTIHRSLGDANNIILYPRFWRQYYDRFLKEIKRIYYYIK